MGGIGGIGCGAPDSGNWFKANLGWETGVYQEILKIHVVQQFSCNW